MSHSITVVLKCQPGSKLRRRLINAYKEKKAYEGAFVTAISLKDELSKKDDAPPVDKTL